MALWYELKLRTQGHLLVWDKVELENGAGKGVLSRENGVDFAATLR
jgi:hypothetical protein